MKDDDRLDFRPRLAEIEYLKTAMADFKEINDRSRQFLETAHQMGAIPKPENNSLPLGSNALAEVWLVRAEEARRYAETLEDGYSKHLLLSVASDYERFAKDITG
jgi:hypothetical protein